VGKIEEDGDRIVDQEDLLEEDMAQVININLKTMLKTNKNPTGTKIIKNLLKISIPTPTNKIIPTILIERIGVVTEVKMLVTGIQVISGMLLRIIAAAIVSDLKMLDLMINSMGVITILVAVAVGLVGAVISRVEVVVEAVVEVKVEVKEVIEEDVEVEDVVITIMTIITIKITSMIFLLVTLLITLMVQVCKVTIILTKEQALMDNSKEVVMEQILIIKVVMIITKVIMEVATVVVHVEVGVVETDTNHTNLQSQVHKVLSQL